ncbi:hypothetical protein XA68_17283 [Ophiocordyceps unilateralis]|uniref:BTB domain-containing protein n=1 Tax=Ophiocordyceps unilateralis TaxID=268505 RepID=A0A2A9PPK7_OPHUN|nr:hypothetical protein XA68_17283 [Ophiocordyceps unilateralis]
MSTNSAMSALMQLMESGDFSDLTFSCNDMTFSVHKAIVCGQSPVIRAAISGNFEESQTNVILMHAFEPETVRRLVQFLYTGDYSASSDASTGDGDNPVQGASPHSNHDVPKEEEHSSLPQETNTIRSLNDHIKVNSIGDYYGVTKLVSLANEKISAVFLAGQMKSDKALVQSIPAATKFMFASTGDNELVDILSRQTAANISTLRFSDDFKNLEAVSDYSLRIMGHLDDIAATDRCKTALLNFDATSIT